MVAARRCRVVRDGLAVRVAYEPDWLPIRIPAPSMAMHPNASRLPAPCSPPWSCGMATVTPPPVRAAHG
jgi:hypothetical protein